MAALALLAAGLAATAGLGYTAWQRIEAQGGLTQFLQDSINNQTEDVFATIGSTRLELRLSSAPVRLIAENIRLGAVDAELVLPKSEFGFTLAKLLQGQIVPTEMEITGPELDIEYSNGDWRAGPSVVLVTGLMGQGEALRGDGALDGLREIRVVGARLRISRVGGDETTNTDLVVIEPITFAIKQRNRDLEGSITATDPDGGTAVVDFTSDKALRDLNLTATVAGLDVSAIYPYLGIDLPEISEIGEVGGVVNITVVDREVTGLSGDVVALGGRMGVPGRNPFDYERAGIAFAYNLESDLLTVTNLDLLAPAPGGGAEPDAWRLLVSGQVRGLSTPSPTVFAGIRSSNLPLATVLDAWPEDFEPTLRDIVTGSIQGGNIAALGLDTVGVIDRRARVFRLTSIDVVTEMRSMRLETAFASVDRLVGTLSSRLELSIAGGGAIRHAAANLLLEDAQLLTGGASRLVDLEGVELRASLDGSSLVVERAAIDARHLGQLAMAARFDLEPDRHARRLDLQVRAERIDMELVSQLWPAGLRPRTRQWVSGNIEGGVINGLVVDAGFGFPREGGFESLYLKGNADLSDARVRYLGTLPPLEGLEAAIGFEGRAMHVDALAGSSEGLAIDGSRFIIRNSEAGAEVDLALLIRGDFGGAVRLLDHEQLNLLAPAGIEPTAAAGTIDAKLGMKWLHSREGGAGRPDITMTASVAEAMLDGLPGGTRLDNGTLDIMLAGGDLTAVGHGEIEGAPAVLDLVRRPDGQIEADIVLANSEQLTAWIGSRVPVALGGATSARIDIDKASGKRGLEMDVLVDLGDTSIDLARLGLAKPRGEAAELNAHFSFDNGRLVRIRGVRLASDVLTASGNLSFDDSGVFREAAFSEIAWPGNDLSNISVERNAEGTLQVSAEAGVIDLTPLRREQSPGEGVALEVTLISERVIVDPAVTLSGEVVLKTATDGVGEAEFLGGLFLKGEPFMTEAFLRAMFGGGADLLEGTGKIGGVEANVTLRPGGAEGNVMEVRTSNAGQVLKALNITEAIRSGEMHLIASFDEAVPGHLTVEADLRDFNVVKAPQVLRWMSVLSLPGLLSLLDGDGTNFREGYARIEVLPGKQVIHRAQASGAAVGLDLVGVIYPVEKRMEVSGTMVPLNLLTQIIENVPLFGQILTGFDKSGVFATQFTLIGPIDDPEGTVNTSSIAPGFIRDIFSHDWVRKECERLIPDSDSCGDSGARNGATTASPDEQTGGDGAGEGG